MSAAEDFRAIREELQECALILDVLARVAVDDYPRRKPTSRVAALRTHRARPEGSEKEPS